MASKTLRIAEATRKRRESERATREERFLTGTPEGFLGPLPEQPVPSTPEDTARQALARAAFLQQELANYQPPSPEESGVSRFARSGFGRYVISTKAPMIAKRNEELLQGTPEQERLSGRFKGALGLADIAQSQSKLSQQQQEEARLQESGQIMGGVARDPTSLSTQGPRALAQVAAVTRNPSTFAQAIESVGTGQRNLTAMDTRKQEETGRKAFYSGFQELLSKGRASDPEALLALEAHVASQVGDYSRAGDISSRYANLQQYQAEEPERNLRLQIMQMQLQKLQSDKSQESKDRATRVLNDTFDIYQKLLPTGEGIDTAASVAMALHGEIPDSEKQHFNDALDILRGPIQEASKIEAQIKAAKGLEDQQDTFIKQRGRFFDANDNPIGWLSQSDPDTGKPRRKLPSGFHDANGKMLTTEDYLRSYFDKRGQELFLGTPGEQGNLLPPGILEKLKQNQGTNTRHGKEAALQSGGDQGPQLAQIPQTFSPMPSGPHADLDQDFSPPPE